MKKMIRLLNLAILLPLISACGQTPSAEDDDNADGFWSEQITQISEDPNKGSESVFELVDSQNRKVTIDKNKRNKVICLGAGALRMYSYIGDMSKLIAIEDIDRQPFGVGTALRPYYSANKELFASLPSAGKGGPMAQAPEMETLSALNPEIIVSIYSDPSVNDQIATTLNIPVIALTQGNNGIYDKITCESLQLLGKAFDKVEKTNQLLKYIADSKEEFKKLNKSSESYYAGCIGNWGKTNLYGSFDNFPVFRVARVKNALEGLSGLTKNKQVTIDSEKLLSIDPDKIFIDGAGFAGFAGDYRNDPSVYNSLKAFKNKETYSLLPYNAYYTNLEIQMISTYYVASIAHPEAFKNLDIAKKANEITSKFLGKEMYEEMKSSSTSLGGYQKINIEELVKGE